MEMKMSQKHLQRQQPFTQMLHSLTVLQMNAQELREYVKRLALENPVVEILDSPVRSDAHIPDSWRGRVYNEQLELVDRRNTQTLAEELRFQLLGMKLSQSLRRNVEFLIGCLDENGYLSLPLSELVSDAHPKSALEQALAILHSMEPRGVGARSLSECLILQLQDMPDNRIAIAIAKGYLPELAKCKLPQLAQMLDCSLEEVEYAVSLIRKCVPKPANGYAPGEATPYILPDLYIIENEEGRLQIVQEETANLRIQINPYYRTMVTADIDTDTAKYLKECISQASPIIGFVAKRNITLMQCAQILVTEQEAFFRHGPSFLRPLSLREVAQKMQVSESTVSRAIQGKYFRCIWGLFPLKRLLSRSISGGEEGNINAVAACEAIAAIVAKEDKKNPLSDQAISQSLLPRGIAISRRTVAKYRGLSGIAPAAKRKQV